MSDIFEKAKHVIPGGVNSPVRAFKSVGIDPVFVDRADGAYMWDTSGKKYIDYVGSWGPMIMGHNHPHIREAVQKALEKGTSFGACTEAEVVLAEKICNIMPSIEMVRLVNSGTEATMSAVRLARGFTGRRGLVKFRGCYHGHGDSFLIEAGSGALTFGVPSSPGVTAGTAGDTLLADYNDLNSVEQLFVKYPKEIACVIIEPIAGNMGVVAGKPEFLQGLRSLCDKYGALLIFDEVMTGFRVALQGAQSLYGIKPDLTTLGKIIGGGLPVGAYGGRRDVMEMLSPVGPVYQAGTLSGNPLATAAGIASLECIEAKGFYENLNKKSEQWEAGIRNVLDESNVEYTINRVGSMMTLFFTKGPVTSYSEATRSDTKKYAAWFRSMLSQGVYLAPSQFEAGFLSSSHTDADLQRTVDVAEIALKN